MVQQPSGPPTAAAAGPLSAIDAAFFFAPAFFAVFRLATFFGKAVLTARFFAVAFFPPEAFLDGLFMRNTSQ
jgi:hypothetical protein